jgi:hypothetical protein
MKHFVGQDGGYLGSYDNAADTPEGAVEVPAPPEGWNSTQWAPVTQRAAVLAELQAIDRASIRAMREYIASQPDAPQRLKDIDAAAAMARAKMA